MSGIRVSVTGASIAGPALAYWLDRRGAGVTVVEQAPGLPPDPDAGPSPEPDMEALTALIERAVGGPELPDYESLPVSGAPA